LHAADTTRFDRALESLTDAVTISDSYTPTPLVIDRITA
jgi:thymidine phosphorylase